MSRSFRHNPCLVDGYKNRGFVKRQAAKAIRSIPLEDEVGNNNSYRRRFPQYDMREYSFYSSNAKSKFFRRVRSKEFEPVIDTRRQHQSV